MLSGAVNRVGGIGPLDVDRPAALRAADLVASELVGRNDGRVVALSALDALGHRHILFHAHTLVGQPPRQVLEPQAAPAYGGSREHYDRKREHRILPDLDATRASCPARCAARRMTSSKQPQDGNGGISDAEDVVDALLAVPPERFTQERNAAAKRLRADGRRDAADAIKGLPRPPLSLWALNQLAHRQPSLIEAFLRAAGQLREAYRSGGDIRSASSPEREAEARVVAAAVALARSEGMSVTEGVVERLRQTMRAAAASEEVAEDLRDGRMIREPEVPTIAELLSSMPQPSGAARTKSVRRTEPDSDDSARVPPRRENEAARLALREQIAAAEVDASKASAESRAAAEAARKAGKEWERAQGRAEQSKHHSDAAAEYLRDLQQRLEKL